MPAAEQTLAREVLPHQIIERCVLQVGKDGLDFRRRCAVHRRDSSKAALLLHVRYKHAVRAEGTGIAGNENAADAELGCDHSGDGRAHAAERHERKFARIVTAFDRDGAHRHHHVGDEHAQNTPGRLDLRHAERLGDARRERLAGFRRDDRHGAVEQRRGIEMAEQHERIGQRRLAAATAIARRARIGAGALRSDFEDMSEVYAGNAAAAGADRLDVDRVGPQRMSGDLHLRFEQRPPRQHGHVAARAAGVEGDEIIDAFDVAQITPADDARHRS